MADKEEIIVDGINVSECVFFNKLNRLNICCCDDIREDEAPLANFCVENKDCYFKQRARAREEYEELRRYHNKCCKENAEKLEQWLEKYNQLSRDFYNGKYCNKENCGLLKDKEQECEAQRYKLNYYIEKTTQLLDDIDNYHQVLDEIEKYCEECNLKYGSTACEILDIIDEAKEK